MFSFPLSAKREELPPTGPGERRSGRARDAARRGAAGPPMAGTAEKAQGPATRSESGVFTDTGRNHGAGRPEGGRALPVRPISEGGNSRGGAAAGPALARGPGAKRGPGPGTARKATEGSRPAPREQQTEPHAGAKAGPGGEGGGSAGGGAPRQARAQSLTTSSPKASQDAPRAAKASRAQESRTRARRQRRSEVRSAARRSAGEADRR